MIGVGVGPMFAAAHAAGALTELQQIQAAMAAGVVDAGTPASTYALEADGGAPDTAPWEDTLDGGSVAEELSHYIVGADRATTYVRGAISSSRDIAQAMLLKSTGNANFEFGTAYLLARTALNTVESYTAGTALVPGGDDACPVLTDNAGFLMANHGLLVPAVTSTGHDKASGDIGSIWSDGTHQFVLAEIAGNVLTFYPVAYSSSGSWVMRSTVAGTLTPVSGAEHPADITVTSQGAAQRYPAVKNLTTTILANGLTELAGGAEGLAVYVDFVEEFDLVDPSTLDTANSPWVWNDGSVWMHVRHVYRCYGGATVLHTTYALAREMRPNRFGYLQLGPVTAAAYAHQYYYVPKSQPISGYDFAAVQLMDDGPPDNLVFTSAYVDDVENPIDRTVILFEKTGETNYDLALAIGYSPYGDGAAAARVWDDTWGCWRIGTTRKLYPIGQAGLGIYSTGSWEAFAYRQWVDPKQYDHDKLVYWHAVNGRHVVYVDFHRQVSGEAVALPANLVGKTITVVDSKACTTGQSTIPASGLLILTTSATHGFIVVELT